MKMEVVCGPLQVEPWGEAVRREVFVLVPTGEGTRLQVKGQVSDDSNNIGSQAKSSASLSTS